MSNHGHSEHPQQDMPDVLQDEAGKYIDGSVAGIARALAAEAKKDAEARKAAWRTQTLKQVFREVVLPSAAVAALTTTFAAVASDVYQIAMPWHLVGLSAALTWPTLFAAIPVAGGLIGKVIGHAENMIKNQNFIHTYRPKQVKAWLNGAASIALVTLPLTGPVFGHIAVKTGNTIADVTSFLYQGVKRGFFGSEQHSGSAVNQQFAVSASGNTLAYTLATPAQKVNVSARTRTLVLS